MSIQDRIRRWHAIVEAHGLAVLRVERSKHLKLRLSGGYTLIIATTPTDWRNDLNALHHFRRMIGWQAPRKPAKPPPLPKAAKAPPPPSKPPWTPGTGIPERILNPLTRERLRLDRPPPKAVRSLGRPLLRLPCDRT